MSPAVIADAARSAPADRGRTVPPTSAELDHDVIDPARFLGSIRRIVDHNRGFDGSVHSTTTLRQDRLRWAVATGASCRFAVGRRLHADPLIAATAMAYGLPLYIEDALRRADDRHPDQVIV